MNANERSFDKKAQMHASNPLDRKKLNGTADKTTIRTYAIVLTKGQMYRDDYTN